MNNCLLIIFVKNPELGKVKTRIAKEAGDELALAIYHKLLSYTREVALDMRCQKAVFYSDYIDKEDKWENNLFLKFKQQGADLGERMLNAFQQGFALGYCKICLIGSDNLEITPQIIQDAFKSLEYNEATIGPTKDGGYYLLGLTQVHPELFNNKLWSTSTVFKDTIIDLQQKHLKYHTLPELNDIDTLADWEESRKGRDA